MVTYLMAICGVLIGIIAIYAIFRLFGNKRAAQNDNREGGLSSEIEAPVGMDSPELEFVELDALTEEEHSLLTEIKDNTLLDRIYNSISGTAQTAMNIGAVTAYQKAGETMGQLYQAIIPKGAALDNSRAMKGAVRGTYRNVSNSIKGHANLVPVDNTVANNLATVSTVNSAMNIASLVVGQYYMTQISSQLNSVNARIKMIEDFQQTEFKGKVFALVSSVQNSAKFQVETIENNEVRNRELTHIKQLEDKCKELLGQANFSLQAIAGKQELDYDAYEKQLDVADTWYYYQQGLLEVMRRLSDLTFTLNLGAISRSNSYESYRLYEKQSEDTLASLGDWHRKHTEKFEISIEDKRRKRQGLVGYLMRIPGLFYDDLNYKEVPQKTLMQIENQADNALLNKTVEEGDLYQEDVRLIAKDGRLYYLPQKRYFE